MKLIITTYREEYTQYDRCYYCLQYFKKGEMVNYIKFKISKIRLHKKCIKKCCGEILNRFGEFR